MILVANANPADNTHLSILRIVTLRIFERRFPAVRIEFQVR